MVFGNALVSMCPVQEMVEEFQQSHGYKKRVLVTTCLGKEVEQVFIDIADRKRFNFFFTYS
jgi:hypothetical protein